MNEQESLFHFRTGTGKQKSFHGVWDWNRKYKNHSRSLRRERENPNFIPGKRTGNGKFKSVLKLFFLKSLVIFTN